MFDGWDVDLFYWELGFKVLVICVVLGVVLFVFGLKLFELWGGLVDLVGSNNIMIKGVDFFGLFLIFIKEYIVYWYGCILYFGVCEYVMGVILFGIVLYGFIWVYGGIFL